MRFFSCAVMFLIIFVIPSSVPTVSAADATAANREDPGKQINEGKLTNVFFSNATSTDCAPASIESFPRPLIDAEMRAHGGVVVHIVIAVFMVLLVATLCKDYFNPALDVLTERLGVDPEVAGGTFVAAAGALPSLVTSIVGVNVATPIDPSLSSTLGSAVLKAAGIVAIAALFSKGAVKFSAWPMMRSSFFYLVAMILILCVLSDDRVEGFEAAACLACYFLYVTAMLFHESLRSCCELVLGFRAPAPSTSSCAVDTAVKGIFIIELDATEVAEGAHKSAQQGSESQSLLQRMTAVVMRSFAYALSFVIPDCTQPEKEKYFVVTLLLSGGLIFLATYILNWMTAIVGFTFGIPDSVLGVTLLSISSTLPDLISSVLAVRQGQGTIAVSCLLGTNIFEVLVGQGLPWLLQTTVFGPEIALQLQSSGLMYSVLSVLLTILLLPALMMACSWRLNKMFGSFLLIWYLGFVVVSSLYQMNVFGAFNSPSCVSAY